MTSAGCDSLLIRLRFPGCRQILAVAFAVVARVGRGRLLFTSIDFLNHRDKPEVRQLLFSLLRYMESDAFDPRVTVEPLQLQNLFRRPTTGGDAVKSAADAGIQG